MLAKCAGIGMADKKGKGVIRSKGVIRIQLFDKLIVKFLHDFGGMQTPSFAKGALVASAWTDAPKDTKTNEKGVRDAFDSCMREEK
jgi:hypothetical protein